MAKRLNLREYQQNLSNQLRAENLSVARAATLGVKIGGQNWLVDMVDIGEVLAMPALTTVPFTKPWYRGVANVRGKLYGVVDVAAFRQGEGMAETGSGQATGDINNRILLVADRYEFDVALQVDHVLGLRDAHNWRQSSFGTQVEYHDEHGQAWQKLDVSALLDQAEFLQIGS